MKPNRNLDRYFEFDNLSDAEKSNARLSWLELKVVEVIRLINVLVAMVCGGSIASIAREIVGIRSLWLLLPVFLVVVLIAGLLLQRLAVRGAPPHIEFIG